jgi:hypothetical protein
VHVGNREADIYDLFVQPRRAKSELLIRVGHNRKVQHELDYLLPTIEQGPVLRQCTIELEPNPERPERSATLTVRGMQVTIEVPRHHKQPKQCQPVMAWRLMWLTYRARLSPDEFCTMVLATAE